MVIKFSWVVLNSLLNISKNYPAKIDSRCASTWKLPLNRLRRLWSAISTISEKKDNHVLRKFHLQLCVVPPNASSSIIVRLAAADSGKSFALRAIFLKWSTVLETPAYIFFLKPFPAKCFQIFAVEFLHALPTICAVQWGIRWTLCAIIIFQYCKFY